MTSGGWSTCTCDTLNRLEEEKQVDASGGTLCVVNLGQLRGQFSSSVKEINDFWKLVRPLTQDPG